MKKYIFLSLLLNCTAANTTTTTLNNNANNPIDTRVPRYCYILQSLEQKCFRTEELCNEMESEELHVYHRRLKYSCRLMRVERNLLPYTD